MKNVIRLASVTAILVLGFSAWSFDDVEEMLFRSKVEKAISEKYADAIATKLPRDQFNVSVQVTLEPIVGSTKREKAAKARAEKEKADVAAKEKAEKEKIAQDLVDKEKENARLEAEAKAKTAEPARQPASDPQTEFAKQQAALDRALDEETREKKKELAELRPADLMLGMIDAEALIENQQREIASLRADRRPAAFSPQIITQAAPAAAAPTVIQPLIQPIFQNAPATDDDEDRPSFKIARVLVNVGISSRFPPSYLAEVQGWISKRVNAEWGVQGRAVVERMQMPPPEVKAEDIKPQQQAPEAKLEVKAPPTDEEKWLSRFSALQNFLGLAMIAFAGLLSVVLWKFTSGKDHGGGRDIAVKLQGGEASGAPALNGGNGAGAQNSSPMVPVVISGPGGGSGSDEESGLRLKMTLAKTRDLTSKIGTLAFELEDQLEGLIQIWLENGEDGHLKTACLIDTMMNYASQDGGEADWEIPIPRQHERHLAKVFQMMSQLSVEKRVVLLEEAYWDLVSVKTLESEKPKRLFSYLRTIENADLEKVMRQTEPKMKAIALYHLEPAQQATLMRSFSSEERAEVFSEALKIETMSPQELDAFDQRLRQDVNRTVILQPEVGFQRQLGQLLERMTPMEELEILPRLVAQLSDGGRAIRKQKVSLAFVDSWSQRARQLVFGGAPVEDLTSLLRLRPEFRDAVFSVCPPRIVDIINDDLKIDRMRTSDSSAALNALDQRLKNLIASRDLSEADMTAEMPHGEGTNAA